MRRTQLTLIVEDQQHDCFVRKLLKERGYDTRMIRVLKSPHGRGSGEQYVRETLACEVRVFRAKTYIRNKSVVAVTDADELTCKERMRTLEAQLGRPRTRHEAIVLLIPRRNIETWIHHLRGEDVNESETYARLPEPSACQAEAQRMHDCCRAQHHAMLPSMQMACEELKRLP